MAAPVKKLFCNCCVTNAVMSIYRLLWAECLRHVVHNMAVLFIMAMLTSPVSPGPRELRM